MVKSCIKISIIVGFMAFFLTSVVNAKDPDWKEDQNKMFEKISLKPGDVIGKDNWKKVEGLVPDDMVKWVREGKVIMNIGEFGYDASNDAEWDEYGLKHNVGKYSLNKEGVIIETATGKYPKWVYGYPFPEIDLKKDPDAGIKFMHNRDITRGRDGCFKSPFTVEWIGKDGFERVLQNDYYRYNFWGTTEAKDDGNANNMMFMEVTVVVAPYDVSGTAQLTYRKIDGSDDQLYVYIPAIRRTKRMSGANRSDPFMGSDFTIDDGNGWLGNTSKMKWTYITEKIGLMAIAKYSADDYTRMTQVDDGHWKASSDVEGIKSGWQVKEKHTQAPWSPVTCVWVPRKFHIVTCVPEDPFYNMGKMEFWIDKKSLWGEYKLMWDIAGEYWRTGAYMPQFMKWDKITQSSNMHLFYDVKTNHSTVLRSSGKNIFGRDLFYEYNLKNMKKKFSVSRVGTWTK